MKKLLFIMAIAILSGCKQTAYNEMITDRYNSIESRYVVKNGLCYKIIRDYRPIGFRQLDSIPLLNGFKPEVAIEHKYKCTLVYTVLKKVIPNCTEIDTVYLYKNKEGRYEFCESK